MSVPRRQRRSQHPPLPERDDTVFLAVAGSRLDDLIRYAAAITGRQDAEDVAQDALAKAWRYLHTYDGRGSFEGWLFRICRHCALDHVGRTSGRSVELHGLAPPEPVAADPREALALQALVGALPAHQREAFVLTKMIGLSYEEAAEVLEVPVGTIRSRVSRARETLVTDVGAAEAS